MTTHERVVELRQALKAGVPLEYHEKAAIVPAWVTAASHTASADIKRNPQLYRIKK
jgi:hypothetical protein